MPPISTFRQLKKHVGQQDGVVTLDMATLRSIHGADRLGSVVRSRIQADLERNGLRFIGPDGERSELPTYSEQQVRLYVGKSVVGEFIDAVYDLSEQGDQRLRSLAGGADSKLHRIRDIIDE